MTILSIQQLTKVYSGGFVAVDDLNLSVEAGDIFGFIGHNGAGKTTTLKSVVGALHFDQGKILIDGHDIVAEPLVCKSQLAYLPDNPDLYDYLTGYQYINFIADIFEVPTSLRQERVQQFSQRLTLTDQLGNLISTYSHGMKQKLALIAAFVHQPKLLIMDEPFVGLDPEATYHVKQMLHELCEDGSAVFFSTHVLEVAETLCNKIALIDHGQLKKCGTTEEVRGTRTLEEVFLEVVGGE
ncbi:ABC transporter ATP-binding protein [Enterococcus sp. BWM-S5]|uniref:ABC transporter ATP-binding protein n=1 Tax=Enterococcus larvae TaxID=2794352 RepID=A0ABS4CDR2_9ENTE|nr:ABC transporter ATP-binding protein [Enterococcus larvae]MBP1044654.1 ABC transporter ATP-binding protein [Enterococcus larvae]